MAEAAAAASRCEAALRPAHAGSRRALVAARRPHFSARLACGRRHGALQRLSLPLPFLQPPAPPSSIHTHHLIDTTHYAWLVDTLDTTHYAWLIATHGLLKLRAPRGLLTLRSRASASAIPVVLWSCGSRARARAPDYPLPLIPPLPRCRFTCPLLPSHARLQSTSPAHSCIRSRCHPTYGK
eukprot:scaffold27_cov125-Isochrysis_galbana.AAC.5